MRALSYHGPGRITWEPVADPEITHDLDAVIRVGHRHHLRDGPAHSQG